MGQPNASRIGSAATTTRAGEPARDEREIFHEVISCPAARRESLVVRLCGRDDALAGRVRRLVEVHDRLEDRTELELAPPPQIHVPERIGAFRILRRLGEGGMGVVYLAEQMEPVRRHVALKLLKAGSDSTEIVSRFHAERQALALMSHRCIARILDAGVFEGRPFFVMEPIVGEPITQFCDRRQLSVEQRLRLFVEVCLGVQHAHQKGVIHRDLKPRNVLVTEEDGIAVPKIIDFGIAKVITAGVIDVTLHTAYGRFMGTPDYMSPEQTALSPLDVDTRTDVYSLGALLYELLVGTSVFDFSRRGSDFDEIRRSVREEEPVRPSTRVVDDAVAARAAEARGLSANALSHRLQQDLDWIVLRALDKERRRRYASASELAADVTRCLECRPIVARPPSTLYRVGKLLRRHRVVAGAASIVTLALIGSSILSATFALRESRHRTIAERERDTAVAIVEFLNVDLLSAVRPSSGPGAGRDVSMREVLDAAAEYLTPSPGRATPFVDRPVVEAAIRMTLGDTYFRLGAFEAAALHLGRAHELRREHLGEDHPDTLKALSQLGPLHASLGRADDARGYYVQSLELHRRRYGDGHEQTYGALANLAVYLRMRGEYRESETLTRSALEGMQELLGDDHADTLKVLGNLANLLIELDRKEEAVMYSARAADGLRRSLGPRHPSTLVALSNHGSLLEQVGRLDEAEPLLLEVLDASSEVNGPTHPATTIVQNNLASVLGARKRFAEAAAMNRRVFDTNRARLGEDHPQTVIALNNLGTALRQVGRADEALAIGAEAVVRAGRAFPDGHWILGAMRVRHAEALLAVGRFAAAHDEALAGMQRMRPALGGRAERTLDAYRVLAEIHEAWDSEQPGAGHDRVARAWRERQVPRPPRTLPAV